jgi:hypothetical protein
VDIAGAKALKERLGSKAADKAPHASVEVPEDAPPVYRWTGVPSQPSDVRSDEAEPEPGTRSGASLFRRLLFSLR